MRHPLFALLVALSLAPARADEPLKLATFDVDASPPVGTPLAYDPTEGIADPLHCKGVVLLGEGEPIVLVAVDWIGIGNDGQVAFKRAIAEAVGTAPERVAVHTLHQHDAPTCDFSTAALMAEHGLDPSATYFDLDFARDVIARAAKAAAEAKENATPVARLGMGEAMVEMVASNRRILGPDGKVRVTRYTACRDPEVRAEPAGTIDPMLKCLVFYDEQDAPMAALTYYACHPQSYYRTGLATPDFPGLARDARQEATGVPHLHFDGAGGNIGAGKWNDGAPENRAVLAGRVEAAMAAALAAAADRRVPIDRSAVSWAVVPVALPAAPHLDESTLMQTITSTSATPQEREAAANDLVWLRRCEAGDEIGVSCLTIGPARVLHLPGELFVEYQLAAQAMRPDLFVAMAAYGDYAPGYIGTAAAYYQGGYEASQRASAVAPGVEAVLLGAIEQLLGDR